MLNNKNYNLHIVDNKKQNPNPNHTLNAANVKPTDPNNLIQPTRKIKPKSSSYNDLDILITIYYIA